LSYSHRTLNRAKRLYHYQTAASQTARYTDLSLSKRRWWKFTTNWMLRPAGV